MCTKINTNEIKTPINPIIHTLEHGFPFNTPSLPIFTPAASLDFKSANEDDSDYDPFTGFSILLYVSP